MSKQATPEANGPPPTAPDTTEFFNRMALAMSKHQSFISSVTKHHRPAPTSSPSPATTPLNNKPNGFSSLTTTNTTTTETNGTTNGTPNCTATPTILNDPRLTSDTDLTWPEDPANAGIGYIPPPSSSSSKSPSPFGGSRGEQAEDKETALLRRKVLGQNAARQVAERKAANGVGKKEGMGRKRAAEESESEEEVGRGALVRRGGRTGGGDGGGKGGDEGPRKRVKVEQRVEQKVWEMVEERIERRAKAPRGEGKVAKESVNETSVGDVVVRNTETEKVEEVEGEKQVDDGVEKKRKKNKNKKKKKANGSQGEVGGPA